MNNFIYLIKYSCFLKPVFFASTIELKANDFVLIETIRGIEIGVVLYETKNIFYEKDKISFIIRKATNDEINIYKKEKEKEKEIINFAKKAISVLKLHLKILFAEYIFNTKNVIIIYTSDKQNNYSKFIEKINSYFDIKINLQYVNNIDFVRLLDDCFGICGKKVCCSTFLKNKDLVVNKIHNYNLSGLCGCSKCCLNFEDND